MRQMAESKRWQAMTLALLTLALALFAISRSTTGRAVDCAKRLVATGDGVVFGKDADNPTTERYSRQLLDDHLTTSPGPWCEYNFAVDPTTTDQYVTNQGGTKAQQSEVWNYRPSLATLTLGRQNTVIVDHVDRCFKQVKDHDFPSAIPCASAVLADANAWLKLTKDLNGILNTYKTQMSGNPNLVVAVTGYFNPYPQAADVFDDITTLCVTLQDTIPTCLARWLMYPPLLTILDQIVKKLNDTIKQVVDKFAWSSQGRFFFVNPYQKFLNHCMKMIVTLRTTVVHGTIVHQHDSTRNMGCDNEWVHSDGTDGNFPPNYLPPASNGLLVLWTQTTTNMGINPNAKGHDCISDLIYETVKNKLGIPEKPDLANACSDN